MHARPLRASKALSRPSPAENFQGAVRNHAITGDDSELVVLSVWFPAGGRTNCHSHSVDQLLVVTEGEIAVGIGSRRMLLGVGEMVVIPANVWHWHGATPLRDGCHLAVMTRSENDWGQAPPDDQAEFVAYEDWEQWVRGIGR